MTPLNSLEKGFQAGKTSELLNIAGMSSQILTESFGFGNVAVVSALVQSNYEKEAAAG